MAQASSPVPFTSTTPREGFWGSRGSVSALRWN